MTQNSYKKDFPILQTQVHGKPLVYLDSGASTQKPLCVIEKLTQVFTEEYANVHRGAYYLSERATAEFEAARKKVRGFINAKSTQEIIFTRGTTESINLVAQCFTARYITRGDEVLISAMEHHSDIVPWQMACERVGATLKIIPMNQNGELILDQLDELLTSKTKIVCVVHVSNALGTINPVESIIAKAHAKNIPVLLDGAQAIAHMKVDVQQLDCDFYAFSGHKLYGPTGVGVLYGKKKWLDEMPPWQGGGDMITSVTFEKTLYNELPYKFEAGTPAIAEVIALGTAIDYVLSIGWETIVSHENELLNYGNEVLSKIEGLNWIGKAKNKMAVWSMTLEGIHPHDIATILDNEGVAVRAGHHCAQPVMDFFKVPATFRATAGIYTTKEDLDALVLGIKRVKEVFG